jgi:hypothetical protein
MYAQLSLSEAHVATLDAFRFRSLGDVPLRMLK